MPAELDPLDDYSDSVGYRWTIRALYAAAITMNIYVMWVSTKDEAELAIIRAKAAQLVERCREPFRRQKEWRRSLGRMHFEALQVVEEGAKPDGRS